MEKKTILVTGAAGYIASRLIPRLLEADYRVRCLVRRPERLRRRLWYPHVEVIAGDLTLPESLSRALQDVSAAYYLVHSMAAGSGYDRIDLESARNFGQAARQAGLEHIIYLGGLVDEREALATHLRSRIESGVALREAGVPVTEFRAGVIVGPGSVSFEMIRFIAEQFPLMVGPAWLRHNSQPIATQNVLDYLLAALTTPACRGKIIEIGCEDVISYAEIMSRFARVRGLRRGMLLLPFVPAWLMAFFIDKLTPVHISYALPLVEGLKNDSIILNPLARQLFPAIKPLGYTESVQRCLADLRPETVERFWLDPDQDVVHMKHEGLLVDYSRVESPASAEAVFAALCRMGGPNGFPAWNWAWQIRGWIDRLLGGRGLAGREELLREDGILDFYRVEKIRALQDGENQKGVLRLRAELKAPGQGWMEWEVTPRSEGCLLEQTAFFAPKGLSGFLYLYVLYPFHWLVYRGLLRALANPNAARGSRK